MTEDKSLRELRELRELIDEKLEAFINTTWVELLEDKPEVMYAEHDKEITRNQILSIIAARVKGVENPYALQDGTAVLKWERCFDGFESCRESVLKLLEKRE
ncbi:MAG: hypothetical protein WC560_10080 [Syntrophales bacterium]